MHTARSPLSKAPPRPYDAANCLLLARVNLKWGIPIRQPQRQAKKLPPQAITKPTTLGTAAAARVTARATMTSTAFDYHT